MTKQLYAVYNIVGVHVDKHCMVSMAETLVP